MRHLVATPRLYCISLLFFFAVAGGARRSYAEDCNGNGVEDTLDIARGISTDCDEDGIPDECVLRPGISFRVRDAVNVGSRVNAAGQSQLVVGDFNSDGFPDAAATLTHGLEVQILLRTAPRHLTPTAIIPLGFGPLGLADGDFDGDGDLDLVATISGSSRQPGEPGRLAYIENDGTGEFEAPAFMDLSWRPWFISPGDYDLDGDTDLAAISLDSGKIHFLSSDGGAFSEDSPVDLGETSWGLGLADLDADGDLDLIATPGFRLAVVLNEGGGMFGEAEFYDAGPYAGRLAAGDVNGDGKIDLVVGNLDTALIRVFLGDGDGKFPRTSDVTSVWGTFEPRIGDMNGDGNSDIVAMSVRGGVEVLLGDGTGQFGTPRRYGAGTHSPDIELVDADGDSTLDVMGITMAGFGWAEVSTLWNTEGTGDLFASRIFYAWSGHGYPQWLPSWMTSGDIDKDGDLDLALATRMKSLGHEGILLARNDGHGDFSELWYHALPDSSSLRFAPLHITSVDLDDDGAVDLVVGATHGFAVLRNAGDGTFTEVWRQNARSSWLGRMVVEDIDGDGVRDVLQADLELFRFLRVAWGAGPWTFGEYSAISVPAYDDSDPETGPGNLLDLDVTDFDGDGDLDILAFGGAGLVRFFRNLGDREFRSETVYRFNRLGTAMRVGDFNGDGRPDVAVALERPQEIEPALSVGWRYELVVLTHRGALALEETSRHPIETNGPAIFAVDLEDDGDQDLIVSGGMVTGRHHFSTATPMKEIQILLNDGQGAFPTTLAYPSDGRFNAVVAEDFTGDGRRDLAVAYQHFSFSVLANRAPDLTQDGGRVSSLCGSQRFRRGDVDQNGPPDYRDGHLLLRWLFLGENQPRCLDACDSDDDGVINLSDAILLIRYLFHADPSLPPPLQSCGLDPTIDEIGCESYDPCS